MLKYFKDPFVLVFVPVIILALYLTIKQIYLAKTTTTKTTETTNITTLNNKQLIKINAKAGYFPQTTQAKANTETILQIITNNTFDCSTALMIPKLNINTYLKPTQTLEIAISPQTPGSVIKGTCSMGMYEFDILFN